MYSIADRNCYCGDVATRFRREGVTAVIRYYSQDRVPGSGVGARGHS
jgi:hypothetical protein